MTRIYARTVYTTFNAQATPPVLISVIELPIRTSRRKRIYARTVYTAFNAQAVPPVLISVIELPIRTSRRVRTSRRAMVDDNGAILRASDDLSRPETRSTAVRTSFVYQLWIEDHGSAGEYAKRDSAERAANKIAGMDQREIDQLLSGIESLSRRGSK